MPTKVSEIKAQIARTAWYNALTDHGCIFGREQTDNFYNNDSTIRDMIRVYDDADVYGVQEAVSRFRASFPEAFKASGQRRPGGTPPHKEHAGNPTLPWEPLPDPGQRAVMAATAVRGLSNRKRM
jgi:hypothetical protein